MVVASGDVRLPRLLRREAGAEIDRLYRRHADEVLRYALLVLRSRTDAEDITQTVFMRALRAIERGERVRTPRNWLIKIAHNECRRLLSTRKVHAELPDEIAVEPVEQGRAEELRSALSALPETQRRALVLRELEGRSYAEIAASLDLSASAVETLIFRARRSLREQIEGALGCDEFAALLEVPEARAQVRAHARICADCATLERQLRGRKGALKRIASAFGLPGWGTWWGAKAALVAVTAAGVASVAAVAGPHAPAPSQRNLVRPAPVAPAPAGHRTRFQGLAPPSTPTVRARPGAAAAPVPGTVRVPGTRAAAPAATPGPEPVPAPVLPLPAPAPTPTPAPTPVPSTPAAGAAVVPVEVPVVSALAELPDLPAVSVLQPAPAVPLPVELPAVAVPSVQAPAIPVASPNVSLP